MARTPMDHVRQQQARQDLRMNMDKMVRRANRPHHVPWMDARDPARAILMTGGYLVLSVSAFLATVLAWWFTWQASVVRFACVIICTIVVITVTGLCSRKWVMGKSREWLYFAAFLMAQAAAIGFVLGFFLYFRHLAYFWKYQGMRTYTNVAASQSAAGFGDGNIFLFTVDSKLDSLRAVGYESRWTGQTYCVAPIVDSSMTTASQISFWAVGENCCNQRAEFHCDDAADFNARSGLVLLQPNDIVQPWMRWAVKGSSYDQFMSAIALEESTFFTQSAETVTLVRWVKDPMTLQASFYKAAQDECIFFSLIYFAILAVLIFVISFAFLLPKPKKHDFHERNPGYD